MAAKEWLSGGAESRAGPHGVVVVPAITAASDSLAESSCERARHQSTKRRFRQPAALECMGKREEVRDSCAFSAIVFRTRSAPRSIGPRHATTSQGRQPRSISHGGNKLKQALNGLRAGCHRTKHLRLRKPSRPLFLQHCQAHTSQFNLFAAARWVVILFHAIFGMVLETLAT